MGADRSFVWFDVRIRLLLAGRDWHTPFLGHALAKDKTNQICPNGTLRETWPEASQTSGGVDVTHRHALANAHEQEERGAKSRDMEALRESFLNLTFQMSMYKRATLDEEDLVDSTGDDIYPSSPMQVNRRHPGSKNKQRTYNWYAATTQASGRMYQPRRVSQRPGSTALRPNTTAPATTVVQPLISYLIGCFFSGFSSSSDQLFEI